MKLKYIATIAAASILAIVGAACFSSSTIASSKDNTNASVIVTDNPCASVKKPCAAKNPCSGK